MAVAIDQPIPPFQAQATSGQSIDLASLAGKQVVLYFYPKDNTPGCTTEGQGFAITIRRFSRPTPWSLASRATA